MQIEKLKIDEKGRIVLPARYRDYLGLSSGDSLFASLDEKGQTIILSIHSDSDTYLLSIGMGDVPGTLAKLAKVLADNEVDLISTESHSVNRSRTAVWRVMCKLDKKKIPKIEKELKKNGAVSVEIRKN
jgi:AbrB family looped-hinge helix DNA binding protein